MQKSMHGLFNLNSYSLFMCHYVEPITGLFTEDSVHLDIRIKIIEVHECLEF